MRTTSLALAAAAAHCAADDFGDLRPRLTVLCNSTLLGWVQGKELAPVATVHTAWAGNT